MTLDRTGSSILPQQESVRYGWRSPNLGRSPAWNALANHTQPKNIPVLSARSDKGPHIYFVQPVAPT